MPRYAFTPIPIRLPLSDVAALAAALAFTEGLPAPACFALPRLAHAFQLAVAGQTWSLIPAFAKRAALLTRD